MHSKSECKPNPKPKEDMTTVHLKSADKIVEVLVTTDDNRYPRHDAPMVVIKMKPMANTRCRQQWGGITLMPTHDEIRALLKAIQQCEPEFTFSLPSKFKNKPESRKRAFQKWNYRRLTGQR
jgi:hypothetical protein